jgi:nascent polypeptide-associated complex subunit alpha
MFPNVNPRQMNQMMKRMGIQQIEIEATEVIIRTEKEEYIFTNPNVSKVNMMGQETYQVIGSPIKREISSVPDINEEDIETVMEQTGVSKDKAKQAIMDAEGDLAEAIISLKDE